MRFLTNNPSLTRDQAEGLLRTSRERVSVDIETVSLTNTLPLGIAVAISPDVGFYFFNPRDELLKWVVEHTPIILFHNAAFDLPILSKLGYNIQGYEDTMLQAYAGGILEKSLHALSESQLGRACPSVTEQWEGRTAKQREQGNIAIDHVVMGGMCIIHACNTYALWDTLPHTQLYRDIDRPSVDLVMEMERWGVLIDQVMLTEVEQEVVVRANGLKRELVEELGNINFASNPQVASALKEKGILGTRKTKGGKEAVSEEALKPLNHPVANKLLEYRSELKTLQTYLPAFRNTGYSGRLHTTFGYTDTGRWSSSKPNLQNITRSDEEHQHGLRDCIVAEEGYTFLSLDASQIELRVLAILSQDPKLLEDLKTTDLHLATAIRMGLGEEGRYDAKQGNFALVYDADEYKLAEMLGCSVIEAREFMREHRETYPVLYQWKDDTKAKAVQDGYVTNLFGRIRPIPELNSPVWSLREKGLREAINTIVQGTAVDIVKLMMLYLRDALESKIRLVMQVHDEILWEVPDDSLESALRASQELEQAFPDYPCTAKIGKVYGELKSVV